MYKRRRKRRMRGGRGEGGRRKWRRSIYMADVIKQGILTYCQV
jgi:hypothetical protein